MGMDLIPLNQDCHPYHANWTGWRMLAELLCDAGVELTEMAGSNDGAVVDAITATAWAEALAACLDELVAVVVPDPSYSSGYRIHLRTLAGQLEHPTLAHSWAELALRKPGERLPEKPVEVRDADPDDRAWVQEFVTFLRASGGFAQY